MPEDNQTKKTKFIQLPVFSVRFLVFFLALVTAFLPKTISSSDLFPQIVNHKIGIVTDFHAASQSTRVKETPGNIVYPNKYKQLLPQALEKMEAEGIKLVIDLGDNTNNNSKKHAGEIKRIVEEEEMETLWVKGNHDSNESGIMRILGSPSNYYFIDRYEWRIIALDTSEGLDGKENIPGYVTYNGGLSRVQMDWLKDVLKTEKDVIIAMHHPIWDRETLDFVNPIYKEFEEIIEKSGNVRFVFSGHWHTPYWEKELNGIKYFGITALSLEGSEGFYKTMDLPSYYYDNYDPV